MPGMVFEPVPERTSAITDEVAWARIMAEARAEKEAREAGLAESPASRRARRQQERMVKMAKEEAAKQRRA